MTVMFRLATPVLVKVMVWGSLVVPTGVAAKVRLEGDRDTAAGASPVPLRTTDCGLFVALSVRVRVPLTAPADVGAKLMLIVQLAPPTKDAPQLSDSENC